ncbi:MAG: hypothetical protein O3B41_08595 [Bacteroidetes bacterium]|nr:hypothetical protein [Bacteroidota bacterium]
MIGVNFFTLIVPLGYGDPVDKLTIVLIHHRLTRSQMRELNYHKDATFRRANTASMRKIVSGFCRTALDDYRKAGYPFGKTMDGMLVWFEYGQFTTDN